MKEAEPMTDSGTNGADVRIYAYDKFLLNSIPIDRGLVGCKSIIMMQTISRHREGRK